MEQNYGTGRRKTSSARVFLRPGTGKITINGKAPEEYFKREFNHKGALSPLVLLDKKDSFDVIATVKGGGCTGQADAIKLGISRALLENDMEIKPTLKSHGLLTRDSRKVERQKYGQKGARARYQFSKR